jgi:hypothetical protein
MNQAGIVKLLKEIGIFDPGSVRIDKQFMAHTCPFAPFTHRNGTDHNPSLSIRIVDNGYSYYQCWSCKMRGRLFALKHKLALVLTGQGDIPSIEAMKALEEKAIDELPYMPPIYINEMTEKPEPINEAIYENMFEDVYDHPSACAYLDGRGISSGTVSKLDIRYDAVEERIIFPVRGRDGKLYGYTGRTIRADWVTVHAETGKYPKVKDYAGLQKRFFLLNEQNLDNGKPTLVVEGLFALARMVELGIEASLNLVAVLGSYLTPPKINTLASTGNAVYLLFDNDEAGRAGIFGIEKDGLRVSEGAVHHLYGKVPVCIPAYPKGKTDPDELTRADLDFMLDMTYNYVITSGK